VLCELYSVHMIFFTSDSHVFVYVIYCCIILTVCLPPLRLSPSLSILHHLSSPQVIGIKMCVTTSPATEFNTYHHPTRQGLRVPSPHATGVTCAITPRDRGCVCHHPTRQGLRVPSPHATGVACAITPRDRGYMCHHPTRQGLRVPSPHATGVACAITPHDRGCVYHHPKRQGLHVLSPHC
jgi:hypothetical protein